jgi:hypothetical protein
MRRFSGMSKAVVIATVAAALAISPAVVSAQDVATGAATATVLTALSVTATAALAFGNVWQGVAKTVAKNTADAGIFTINGAVNAGLAMFLQLPDFVALADGSDRMPIVFAATDANVDTTGGGDPAAFVAGDGYIDQNPRILPAGANLSDAGAANIYLGGKVIPTVDQKAGAYRADIVLTVAYNGT